MALMQCPECGGKVSSFAAACPHCGYPINARTQRKNGAAVPTAALDRQYKKPAGLCLVNGIERDLTEVLELVLQGPNYKLAAIAKLRDITRCRLAPAKSFVEQLYQTYEIPESICL